MINSDGLEDRQGGWQNRRPQRFMHGMGPTFGDRMNVHSDKELNDLLDFSAMFSPPTGGNGGHPGNHPGGHPGGHPAGHPAGMNYKQGMDDGNWQQGNPPPGHAPPGHPPPGHYNNHQIPYDGQNYDGQNDNMHPFMTKDHRQQYGPGMNSQQQQGMMGNSMPMSPDTLSPGGKAAFFRGRRQSGHSAPGKRSKVYPPAPSPEDYQDSPNRYTSPKPLYGEGGYYMDPSTPHSQPDPWSSNNVPPTSTYPSSMLPGNSHQQYNSNMHHEMQGYPAMSPSQHDNMINSGLPPMSTFRGGQPTTSAYSSTSPTVNGGTEMIRPPASSQTGDALGKALASIYSPNEHTSSNYGSNPSTPVSSPSPLAGSSGQWQRPVQQSSTSPHFVEGGGGGTLHSLSRMEERLDDAIHVLRHHAEPIQMVGQQGMMQPSHSNGIMGYAGGMGSNTIEALATQHNSLSENRTSTSEQSKPDLHNLEQSQTLQQKTAQKVDKKDSKGKETETAAKPPPAKRSRWTAKEKVEPAGPASPTSSIGDDPNESPETKLERERLRRQANNCRERVRVRDINEAFKELGSMVTLHSGSSQPLTKLMVLQQAVNVITTLEQQVRERNLNPKAACLKRREEEKGDEIPGGRGMTSDDIAAQQAALAGKVRNMLLPLLADDSYDDYDDMDC
ncbi:transcription factor 4/12 [Mytilus galloprovincialis]|uniref:Transcription factor 4/12 n=1 Tax=Mytilus galloprovincialis TaxID=29158 RepID=A0A8B6BJE0_MYTGA|nr:transcription factor 4/12 [Mytilus galloprovincialis]